MGRGRFSKPKRGGGHHFTNFRQLQADAAEIASGNYVRPSRDDAGKAEGSSSESGTESEDESGSDDDNKGAQQRKGPLTAEQIAAARAQRKALKRGKKPENGAAADAKQGSDSEEDEDVEDVTAAVRAYLGIDKSQLSRKDREIQEKATAQDKYDKAHAAGKTSEAKADLARLAKIRQEREQAARRKAEESAIAEAERKKKAEIQAQAGKSRLAML